MNRADHTKLIYSGKYTLPLDSATKKSYKIIIYRSTIQKGIIENIELPELQENYYIIDAKDLKGKNSFSLTGIRIPILACDKVNYIGEPILIILGPDISGLKSIYKKIKITYKPINIEEEQEIFFSKTITTEIQEENNEMPYKSISGNISTQDRVIPVKYLHGSFTKRESDILINYSSNIWGSNLRDNLATLCNVDNSKIKIITPTITGENECPLLDSYRAAFFTTVSASIIKKNVLYSPTPEDQFLFSSKIYGLKTNWKINFDRENRILGLEINVTLNCGAFPILVKEKVLRVIHGLTSFYKHRNVKITVTAIKTNLPPGAISDDLYLSDALFTAELLTSKIIAESGKDQLNWRLNNILKKGYKNSSNSIIKREIPLDIMLQNIAHQSDFSRKNSSINLTLLRKDKRILHSSNRGVGISIGYNGNSFISNSKELMTNGVTVQLNRDGKADLHVSCRLNNLELLTIWEDILIEILGIEREAITFYTEDSSQLEDSAPNMSNQNVSILTPLIRQCCEELKERRFKDPLPIRQTKITRRKSSVVWNMESWKGEPFKNTSYVVCAVEVEVDKRSLSCYLKEIWIEIEVGQILNKSALLNTINKEINNTVLWLQEPTPTISNGSFSVNDFYNKVSINTKPKINITIHETGKNKNIPKGVGSLIKNSLPAAFIQGLNQALGANISTFPVTKDMIFRELIKDEI